MANFSKQRTVILGGKPTHFGSTAPVWMQSDLKALWCDTDIEMQIAEARAYLAHIAHQPELEAKYSKISEDCQKDLAGLSNCSYF